MACSTDSVISETTCLNRTPPIRALFASLGNAAHTQDCVVVDAAQIELVSTANSLLTGKRTGNFRANCLDSNFEQPRSIILKIEAPRLAARKLWPANCAGSRPARSAWILTISATDWADSPLADFAASSSGTAAPRGDAGGVSPSLQ
jgi:hypothetical protein